eukprot:TRINITY_DN39389_c0_g1_i1.p1 TRINITY_DN39389_c0_g1~~TRINITY_DN39389_c0_g1_i1.p1  ORF type:complete len:614 (+),score=242.13 TRINITY_DN39389_c0_g1_i1:68-1843(+)
MVAALLVAAAAVAAVKRPQTYHVKALAMGGTCEVVSSYWDQIHRLATDQVFVTEGWEWHECDQNGEGTSRRKVLNFYGPTEKRVWRRLQEVCHRAVNTTAVEQEAQRLSALRKKDDTEIRRIVGSGDSANRIDVVLMGDGYTMAERAKFFDDMQRLTDDMFTDITFQSFLPVFNIWAIHVPSQESGIGTHSTPKNTPFRLYRQGTQLRGVYTGNAQAARDTCKLADACDFPSIIANDDYYGGLGGEFVIGTRSKTTGTVVLRHEMGHNFVDVGEEYDDGNVYRGVNSERVSNIDDLKWAAWLTEPEKPVVRQRAVQRLGEYPWVDLADGKQKLTFTSDGAYSKWFLRFTVSGCPEQGSLRVYLDGKELNWAPNHPDGAEQPDGTTLDRQFYTYGDMNSGFSAGSHTLEFESGFAPPAGRPIRQLCSLSLNEYGSEAEFKMEDKNYVGAYPTWDVFGRETLRPVNELCLMRNMSSPHFCPVCKEGMWRQFFARMSAIDDITAAKTGSNVEITLTPVALGQFRTAKAPEGVSDSLEVTWTLDGKEKPEMDGRFQFTLPAADAAGRWEATVKYSTTEVRADPDNLLTFTATVDV